MTTKNLLTPRKEAESIFKRAVLNIMGELDNPDEPLNGSKTINEAFQADEWDELEIMLQVEVLIEEELSSYEFEIKAKTIGQKLSYLEQIIKNKRKNGE